ncbi:MAG: hypothetical protein ACP5RD_06705 [bacterium]|jgi:hypothetical protein
MNKEEIKEVIKEVLNDKELIKSFSKNFLNGLREYVTYISNQQSFNEKIEKK